MLQTWEWTLKMDVADLRTNSKKLMILLCLTFLSSLDKKAMDRTDIFFFVTGWQQSFNFIDQLKNTHNNLTNWWRSICSPQSAVRTGQLELLSPCNNHSTKVTCPLPINGWTWWLLGLYLYYFCLLDSRKSHLNNFIPLRNNLY
jgi:hypothetical protein